MAQTAIDNTTLSERVYRRLRAEILANRIAPGQPLHEVTLAGRLGVSRAPVRAAIQRLTVEHLAEARPRRAAVVASLSPKAFLDLYQVREALEVLAVRLAVPRLSDGEKHTLRRMQQQMARAGAARDVDAFFDANTRFHRAIVGASGNERLIALYNQLLDEMRRYRLRSLTLRGGWSRSIEEHAAVLAAIEAGDAAGAARRLGRHIRIPQEVARLAAAEAPASADGKAMRGHGRRTARRATGGER